MRLSREAEKYVNEYKEQVDGLIDHIKELPRAEGFDEILMPGEKEERTRRANQVGHSSSTEDARHAETAGHRPGYRVHRGRLVGPTNSEEVRDSDRPSHSCAVAGST